MSLKEYFEFFLPTKVIFGAGLANEVGEEAEKLQCSSAFLLTDKGVEGAGLVDPVRQSLEECSVELAGIYTDIPVNSEIQVVKEIAEKAKGVDLLVSVGGGSVMDTAKGVSILLGVGGDLLDWQGSFIITQPLLKQIAIPTTAGTGAEVTLGAVIRSKEEELKISFSSEYILPAISILDPELTLTMPRKLTAATGIDALTHVVESFTSLEHNPPSDALAYQAVDYIFKYLPRAYLAGDDLEARSYMLIAADFGGICINHTMSIGACHALAHSVGGVYAVPHGLANAILLPHIMEFNLEHAVDRYAALAPAAGLDTSNMSEAESARTFIDQVKELIAGFDLPRRLSEAGASDKKMEKLVEGAMGDAQIYSNPRPAEAEDVEKLFKAAL